MAWTYMVGGFIVRTPKLDIFRALKNGDFAPARKGGVYIRRERRKSIIITNISYEDALRIHEALKDADFMETEIQMDEDERSNVILVRLKRIVRVEEGVREEPVTVTAPSGFVIRTVREIRCRRYVDVVTGEVVKVEEDPLFSRIRRVGVDPEKLGIKVEKRAKRGEDEVIWFNDGTVLEGWDEMDPKFKPSPLFECVEDAARIWLRVAYPPH